VAGQLTGSLIQPEQVRNSVVTTSGGRPMLHRVSLDDECPV